MAVRPIRQAGDPVLHRKAKKVTSFNKTLEDLVRDMVDTMHAAPGVGLAAPQIGIPLQVFVARVPPDDERVQEDGGKEQPDWVDKLFVVCNPEIVKGQGEQEGVEGCLSLPGFIGEIKRARTITIKGKDLKGKDIRIKAQGLLARVFQHEIDHLNGHLFTDRLESLEKLRRIPEE